MRNISSLIIYDDLIILFSGYHYEMILNNSLKYQKF